MKILIRIQNLEFQHISFPFFNNKWLSHWSNRQESRIPSSRSLGSDTHLITQRSCSAADLGKETKSYRNFVAGGSHFWPDLPITISELLINDRGNLIEFAYPVAKMFNKRWALYVIAAILLIAALTGLYSANHRFSEISPGGNDFVPRWLGTRLLLKEGLNPYSSETSQRIQLFLAGRFFNSDEDQNFFVYPLFSFLFFAPFSLIEDYTVARALWMTWLEIALVIIVLLSIQIADFKVPPVVFGLLLLFAFFWYHDMRGLINGNPAILSALFIAISLAAIKTNRDVLAGLFLGFSTIKPQIVILLIPFVFFWSFSHRRWPLIISTICTITGLVIFGLIIEPNWLAQNFEQIQAYPDYTLPGTPSEILELWWPKAGGILAVILSGAVLLVMILFWVRSWKGSYQVFVLVSFATIACTNLVGIQTATANYVALLMGALLISLYLLGRRDTTGTISALLFSGFLLFGVWTLFLLTRSGRGQSPALFFPAPVSVILLVSILLLTMFPSRLPRAVEEPANDGDSAG